MGKPVSIVAVALLGMMASAVGRPWRSSEEFESWGSYSGIGGNFGGSLSANLGGNFGLGLYHNQQQDGGRKGTGINIFGSGTSSLSGSGFGNFGFFSGGHRYPKGYGFRPFGHPGASGNQPPSTGTSGNQPSGTGTSGNQPSGTGTSGDQPSGTGTSDNQPSGTGISGSQPSGNGDNNQPDQQASGSPNIGPSSNPELASPAQKPSIQVPFEVDTAGVGSNAPQPEVPESPNTSQTEVQSEYIPYPPAADDPIVLSFPRDSASVDSKEYDQSKENPLEFLSAEADFGGGEATSDEVLLGGAGILNPRVGLDLSSEEKKPNFFQRLRRIFG